MTELPFESDIQETNQIIYNFVKSKKVKQETKTYLKKIYPTIQKWNLASILEATKEINYPLLNIKTNIIESINRVLKYNLLSKRKCSNWVSIIKKIICYSA